MLKVDFDIVPSDIELPKVTKVLSRVIETLDRLSASEVLAVINEEGLEFTISRENEEDYWEVDSITKKKDGYTNRSVKA